jgi:hypothetical protein
VAVGEEATTRSALVNRSQVLKRADDERRKPPQQNHVLSTLGRPAMKERNTSEKGDELLLSGGSILMTWSVFLSYWNS